MSMAGQNLLCDSTGGHLRPRMDHVRPDMKAFASEFLRALRGKRSQVTLSRRLGYKSNVAYRWEHGRAFPTAARAFWAYEKLGGSSKSALTTFFGTTPAWVDRTPATTAEGIIALIAELRGKTPITDLVNRSGYSRFRLSRWINGNAEPSLPDLLGMIDAMSPRLADFLVSFFEPELLPKVASYCNKQDAARKAAYEEPWSHLVLRCLELEDYRNWVNVTSSEQDGTEPTAQWIADRTGLHVAKAQRSLQLLELSGQIHQQRGKWELAQVQAVDTRNDAGRSKELKTWWLQQAVQHQQDGQPGLFSYNLFAVSKVDLDKIEQLQRRCYREMSAIVAESEPSQCVGLFAAQLVRLDERSS